MLTFTERGFILHKVIYKLRDDLNVLLVFLSKRVAATILKNVYFILILFPLVEYTVGASGSRIPLVHLQLDTIFFQNFFFFI